MKKKLLAGILALALCSTNMPIQTIFAGEFTSGNPDVVSEKETLEIFTNEEQEAAGETDEELSVFSSEELPEFNDAPDEAMAAAENARIKEIDLINSNEVINGVYTISSAGDYKFTCSNQETANRIVVDRDTILKQDNINIYLDNVNIKTSAVPALQIQSNVKAQVSIYLKGNNNLNSEWKAALQKDNAAKLTIDNSPNTTGELIATSKFGAGIGGDNNGGTGSNITISGGSVTATSGFGAGIGGGSNRGTGSNITISGGSVTATSDSGAGIGGGQGSTGSNITISGGSVKAYSDRMPGINCTPHNGNSTNVYCCIIKNEYFLPVTIDSESWKPSYHIFPDSTKDGNLYVWLTEKENNDAYDVTVGTEKRQYSFDQAKNQFVRIQTTPTADQFDYTQPNFT